VFTRFVSLTLRGSERLQWLNDVTDKLPKSACDMVDVEGTQHTGARLLFTRIEVKLKNTATRDDAWLLKRELEKVLATGVGLIRDLTPYVVVEPSPSMRPLVEAGGRFMGYLQEKGVAKDHIKPEWGPPLRVCDVRGPRPVPVAEFDAATGWAIQQAAFESLVPGTTVETARADLRK